MSTHNSQAALAGAKARIVTLERNNVALTESLEQCHAALSGAEISIEQMVSTNRSVVDSLHTRMEELQKTNERLLGEALKRSEDLHLRGVQCNTLRKEKSELQGNVGKYKRLYRGQFIGTIVMAVVALIVSISAGIN